METIQEQRDLIEKLVRTNAKFSGNEDLFEDFCSETYKRSHSLFKSLDINHLESYIAKVTNTAILTVLKNSGRIQRKQSRYVSTGEIPAVSVMPKFTPIVEETPQVTYSEPVDITPVFDYDVAPDTSALDISDTTAQHIEHVEPHIEPIKAEDVFGYEVVTLDDIPDPRESFEEKIVRKDLLQKVVDIVLVEQKNQPEKEFLRIFYLRYIKEMKQREIAIEVNISQSEVSKRLVDIANLVKKYFN